MAWPSQALPCQVLNYLRTFLIHFVNWNKLTCARLISISMIYNFCRTLLYTSRYVSRICKYTVGMWPTNHKFVAYAMHFLISLLVRLILGVINMDY